MLWFSPDPRWVVTPDTLHVPRRLARVVRQGRFTVTLDTAFEAVVAACATAPRGGQFGGDGGGGDERTWITPDMATAYARLHALGVAHSAEAWHDGALVGGLYGVSLGGMFAGESMFARRPDASKVAFVALVAQLARWGIDLIDVQVESAHLARFGARPWPRTVFLDRLAAAMRQPTRRGRWRFDGAQEG